MNLLPCHQSKPAMWSHRTCWTVDKLCSCRSPAKAKSKSCSWCLLFLSSLWSDLSMWWHFLIVLNLRNPNLWSSLSQLTEVRFELCCRACHRRSSSWFNIDFNSKSRWKRKQQEFKYKINWGKPFKILESNYPWFLADPRKCSIYHDILCPHTTPHTTQCTTAPCTPLSVIWWNKTNFQECHQHATRCSMFTLRRWEYYKTRTVWCSKCITDDCHNFFHQSDI